VLFEIAPAPLAAQAVFEVGQSNLATTVFCRFINASSSKVRGALVEVTSADGTENVVVPAQ
jgi:hypothetical protein